MRESLYGWRRVDAPAYSLALWRKLAIVASTASVAPAVSSAVAPAAAAAAFDRKPASW